MKSESLKIRPGHLEDLNALTEIRNFYILNSYALFEAAPETVEVDSNNLVLFVTTVSYSFS